MSNKKLVRTGPFQEHRVSDSVYEAWKAAVLVNMFEAGSREMVPYTYSVGRIHDDTRVVTFRTGKKHLLTVVTVTKKNDVVWKTLTVSVYHLWLGGKRAKRPKVYDFRAGLDSNLKLTMWETVQELRSRAHSALVAIVAQGCTESETLQKYLSRIDWDVPILVQPFAGHIFGETNGKEHRVTFYLNGFVPGAIHDTAGSIEVLISSQTHQAVLVYVRYIKYRATFEFRKGTWVPTFWTRDL